MAGVAPPPAAGGHGAPHAPAKPQGTAGHWIQQGGKWTLIHAVGPGQWVQGAKAGFKAPPKPGSGQARPANWLQPLSPQQVKSQATSLVSSVYKPIISAYNQQGSQEQAIMAKQESDNQYYQQWLNTKSTALTASQDQVNTETNALEQQLTGNQNALLAGQSANLTSEANARPGNVSNNAGAFNAGSPMGNAMAANQAGNQQIENAAATHSLEAERTAQAQLGASETNASSYLQAGRQKEESAFNTSMNAIATNKANALSKETSAITSEVARLQGVQIAVAENNRNYDTAAQKLGVSIASTNSLINQRAASTKINAQNANTRAQSVKLSAARLNETIAQNAFNDNIKSKQLAISEQKLISSIANTNSEVALRNVEMYQKQHGGGLTQTEQNTWFNIIDKATGSINNLIQSAHLTPKQAYQALLSGSYYGQGVNSKGQTVVKHITVPRLQNQSLLNAAYNLRQGGPGLNAGDVGYLNRLGLQSPTISSRYSGRVK